VVLIPFCDFETSKERKTNTKIHETGKKNMSPIIVVKTEKNFNLCEGWVKDTGVEKSDERDF
jgi:hypothetical protein